MKRFRIISTFYVTCFSLAMFAQVQSGYVKTIGRPNQKGQALSGVSVRIKGAHNAVLSKSDGTFNMTIQGNSYVLQQVQKSDYDLKEYNMIGRKYAYSSQVPLTIVMVSNKQLQEDIIRIENNAYAKAEKDYQKKLKTLEEQKNQNLLTADKYRQDLQMLQNWYGKYESMINDLANHYARTDFDDLDETESKINLCIENGELELADSMLQQLGIQKRIEDVTRRLATGHDIMNKAQSDLEIVLKQQQKDAEYLYQLYTISLGKFDNEKARFYIETRAELDTVNVNWQLDAGQYFCEFLADFPKAKLFLERGLRNAKAIYGEESEQVALAYEKIAGFYDEQKQFDKSLENYLQTYNIRQKLYPKEHPLIAKCYSCIGSVYSIQGDYNKGFEYASKAFDIRKKVLLPPHHDIAESFFNFGYCQVCIGELNDGLDNLQFSLNMLIELHGEKYNHVADAYHNMGYVYVMTGDYAKAEEYLTKGLNIRKQLFGENHPDVSESLNGLGMLYQQKGDFPKALSCFLQALDIRLAVFGEMNRATATSYNNVAAAYSWMENKEKEIEYTIHAFELQKKLLEANNPELGRGYLNISNIYISQGKMEQALEYVMEALKIFTIAYNGADHQNIATCHNYIGSIFADMGQYEDAIEYHMKALETRKKLLGDNHFDTGISCNSIGIAYYQKGVYQEAINYFKTAYEIFLKAVGPNHPQIKSVLNNLDNSYKKYIEKYPQDQKMQEAYQQFKSAYSL